MSLAEHLRQIEIRTSASVVKRSKLFDEREKIIKSLLCAGKKSVRHPRTQEELLNYNSEDIYGRKAAKAIRQAHARIEDYDGSLKPYFQQSLRALQKANRMNQGYHR